MLQRNPLLYFGCVFFIDIILFHTVRLLYECRKHIVSSRRQSREHIVSHKKQASNKCMNDHLQLPVQRYKQARVNTLNW
jgi:hypothetical protein